MNNAKRAPDVVLVADVVESPGGSPVETRRDLEKSDLDTIDQLTAAIGELGRGVVHYRSPQQLADNASLHKADIVLSIYGGEVSRNRMALVPAICETFDLRYVGPDVYGRIIAQDKEVSKRLAVDCGLRTPAWRVIRTPDDAGRLDEITYPCVVKPLLEGSSIGISQRNLTRTPAHATRLAKDLLADLRQPILVEEFIPGRETAFVAIDGKGEMQWAYSEIYVKGSPEFFLETLFDASEKMKPTPGRTVRNIDEELDPTDQRQIKSLLRAVGRFGYCRVDGRHLDGKFHFLEVTPDAWIDPKGQFAMAFTKKGWSYTDVIAAVLASAD